MKVFLAKNSADYTEITVVKVSAAETSSFKAHVPVFLFMTEILG